MSPWRKSLLKGSFRYVPFFTKSTSSEQGRRSAIHEYPLRDIPYVEDLGLKGRTFTLEAYVIGPDYMVARDALIAALEKPGAGELIHPYRGTLNVALTAPARITESADEGGMARFSLTFTESGNNAQPVVRPDTPALVSNAADTANAAVNANFAKSFNIAGMADFVATNAASMASAALNAISTVSNFSKAGPLAELLNSATTISNSLSILMRTPQMLADSIQGQLYGLSALGQNPLNSYQDLQSFFGAGAPASTISGYVAPSGSTAVTIPAPIISVATPSRIQQSINQTAVLDLVRRTAIVESARASSQMTFGSYNDAQATLAVLANALDSELASNTLMPTGQTVPLDDDVYDALLELRVAVVRDISTRGANLAKLTTITLPRTMPALVAAYRIYGDCTMDADLVARNNIRHPGFVPGGVPLEILA